MGIKGQKINPVLWRVGTSRKWKSLWVQDSWNYGNMLHKTLKIQEILESFLVFSRYPSLNCGVTVLNQGSDKFIITVYFYALRSFKYNGISGRKNPPKQNNNQDLKNYWNFETKKLLKNSDNLFTGLLNKEKLSLFKWLGDGKRGARANLKNSISLESKNFKEAFLGEILRKRSSTINKFPAYANANGWMGDGRSSNFKDFTVFSNYSLFLKGSINSSKCRNDRTGFDIDTLSIITRQHSLVGALLLHFYFNPSVIAKQKRLLIMKKVNSSYKIYRNFSCFINRFYAFLFTCKAGKISKKLNAQVGKSSDIFKESSDFVIKTSTLNTYALNVVQQTRLVDGSSRHFNGLQKRTIKTLRMKTEEKLLKIKSLAILNKIKRLNLTKALSAWQSYIEPLTRDFRYYFSKNKNQYRQRKSYLVKVFLERLSHHIYHTMPQSVSQETGIFENKKLSLTPSIRKVRSFGKFLFSRSSLIAERTHLSLKDLHSIIEFLLSAKVELFFVNSLSLLKFQSRFIPFLMTNSTRKFSKQQLFQRIRSAKININRQYQRLSKQPILLANRNSKKGPFLHDFILLALIALTTRNLKVLVRFMGMQISRLGQNKRQIPFIRFLIRLLANLSGTLIKLKGFRIQFKGRFDRWNRTKSIVYTSGNIPFQRQDLDIEFSSSHGLIKKGLFGIRLWIWYGTSYHFLYHKLLISYWSHFINKK